MAPCAPACAVHPAAQAAAGGQDGRRGAAGDQGGYRAEQPGGAAAAAAQEVGGRLARASDASSALATCLNCLVQPRKEAGAEPWAHQAQVANAESGVWKRTWAPKATPCIKINHPRRRHPPRPDITDPRQLLRAHHLLQELPPGEFAALMQEAQLVVVPAGSVVLAAGGPQAAAGPAVRPAALPPAALPLHRLGCARRLRFATHAPVLPLPPTQAPCRIASGWRCAARCGWRCRRPP